jgi:hypothetical protein
MNGVESGAGMKGCVVAHWRQCFAKDEKAKPQQVEVKVS